MDDPRAVIHSLVRRNLGPAKPVKAIPAHVTADMRPDEAFRATLSDCLVQITANAAALRMGRSVAGLHQLRVALRRLDVAVGAFAKEFDQAWLEELRSRGKILSTRLAPARDLDVFVGKLLDAAPSDMMRGGDGLVQLRARAETVRDEAWKRAADCVAGADFTLFVDDVAAIASSRLPLGRDARLPRTASRILDRQIGRVKKRGRAAASSRDEGDLHRLRIALKKLRYTAEFFAPLYARAKVKRYLKDVRGLQEHLGDLNDIANVRETLATVMRAGGKKKDGEGEACFAAGAVAGWYGAQGRAHAKHALKCYAQFRQVKPFW